MPRAVFFDSVLRLDQALYFKLYRLQKRAVLWRSAREISRLGDGPFYGLLLLFMLYLDRTHVELLFFTTVLSFAIELPLYTVLKHTIRRSRPCQQLNRLHHPFKPSDQFSFPSGHTAAAFLMALNITLVYPAAAILAYPLALLIGTSRVVLGVHYPSDIAAGALLGSAASVVALLLLQTHLGPVL